MCKKHLNSNSRCLFLCRSPYPWTTEEHSEYQYPVVLDESKQAASFLNIEDMLFEVKKYHGWVPAIMIIFICRCSKVKMPMRLTALHLDSLWWLLRTQD